MPAEWNAGFMIFLEENVLYDIHIDSRKRIEIDKAGVAFGAKLARNLRKFRSAAGFAASPEAADTEWLADAPGIYGESWRLRPGQAPRDYGANRRTGGSAGHWERYFRTKKAAGETGPAALRALKAGLLDPNARIAAVACDGLAKMGPGAVPTLVSIARGNSPRREMAWKALRAMESDSARREAFRLLLPGRFSSLRADGKQFLLNLGMSLDPRPVELARFARGGLHDESPWVRIAALQAHNGVGDSAAIPAALAALADTDAHVRLAAVYLLMGRRDPRAKTALIEESLRFFPRGEGGRLAARRALFSARVHDPNPAVRDLAREALADHPDSLWADADLPKPDGMARCLARAFAKMHPIANYSGFAAAISGVLGFYGAVIALAYRAEVEKPKQAALATIRDYVDLRGRKNREPLFRVARESIGEAGFSDVQCLSSQEAFDSCLAKSSAFREELVARLFATGICTEHARISVSLYESCMGAKLYPRP